MRSNDHTFAVNIGACQSLGLLRKVPWPHLVTAQVRPTNQPHLDPLHLPDRPPVPHTTFQPVSFKQVRTGPFGTRLLTSRTPSGSSGCSSGCDAVPEDEAILNQGIKCFIFDSWLFLPRVRRAGLRLHALVQRQRLCAQSRWNSWRWQTLPLMPPVPVCTLQEECVGPQHLRLSFLLTLFPSIDACCVISLFSGFLNHANIISLTLCRDLRTEFCNFSDRFDSWYFFSFHFLSKGQG